MLSFSNCINSYLSCYELSEDKLVIYYHIILFISSDVIDTIFNVKLKKCKLT